MTRAGFSPDNLINKYQISLEGLGRVIDILKPRTQKTKQDPRTDFFARWLALISK
jgi:hypothetical protein